MAEIPQSVLEKFLIQVMQIERRYGNELKNARSNRRNDIRELMEQFATKELDT